MNPNLNGCNPPRRFPCSPVLCLMHRRRAMEHHTTFVAMDTHKVKISVALAETGRGREVRFLTWEAPPANVSV